MHVLCAICHDSLEPSNDIFITPCGHVFHFPCLIQWLEKSKTCPQCRQPVKRNQMTRIYFNFSNTEAIKEDSFTLQQKLDSFSLKIKIKDVELNSYREENATLRKQNSGLREEVKKTESEITQKNSVIHALKAQSSYLKQKSDDYDRVEREKKELQKKMQLYENVKVLICGASEDAERMVNKTHDVSSLHIYVAVMKRELATAGHKRRELRDLVKRYQQDIQTLKIENNSFSDECKKRIERLEDALAICMSEKEALEKKIEEILSKDEYSEPVEEISKPQLEKTVSRKRDTNSDITFDLDETSTSKKMKRTEKPAVKKTKENEENSPYLPTKSKSILGMKGRIPSQRSGLPLNAKRTLLSTTKSDSAFKSSRKDPSAAFDGFGGHSKVEIFPVSKSSPNKLKRSASDVPKTKKIKLDLSGNKQLDDYIINLT